MLNVSNSNFELINPVACLADHQWGKIGVAVSGAVRFCMQGKRRIQLALQTVYCLRKVVGIFGDAQKRPNMATIK